MGEVRDHVVTCSAAVALAAAVAVAMAVAVVVSCGGHSGATALHDCQRDDHRAADLPAEGAPASTGVSRFCNTGLVAGYT